MTLQVPTIPRETRRPQENRPPSLDTEKKKTQEQRTLWRERIQQEYGE